MGKISGKILLAGGILSLFLLGGCGGNAPKQEAAQSGHAVQWMEDFSGQTVDMKVNEAPKRAVSMSQATTEMLLTLGLQDHMAGTAFKEEEIYPPLADAYEKVPVLSQKWPSYEAFMAVKPDFVTGWDTAFSKRGIEASKITAQHIPIFVPDSMQSTKADLNTLFQDMLKLGDIFQVQDKAKAWVDGQKQQLAAIQNKIKDLPKKRVFIFDSEDGEPFTVFEGYTTNLLKLIGADNVMSGTGVDKTWAKTSWESVVAANPDYIIVVDYGVSIRNDDDFNQKVEKIKSNPQLQNITAVKENHFIRVKLSEITPGVRSVAALQRLAEEIHGVTLE